ncbi:MAG: alpha-galactosidase [bacterium]
MENKRRWVGKGITPYFCVLTFLVYLIISSSLFWGCSHKAKQEPVIPKIEIQPVQSLYISYDSRSSTFRIGNELIERRIFIDTKTNRIFTSAFINKRSMRNYIKSPDKEFSFRMNGIEFNGIIGSLEFLSYKINSYGDLKNLEIITKTKSETALNVKIIYEIYSHKPVIRKWIEFENTSGSNVILDSIIVESLSIIPGSEYDLEIHNLESKNSNWIKEFNEARLKDDNQIPYPILIALSPTVFNSHLNEGFFLGNEFPGVLKFCDLYSTGKNISIGMKPYFQSYAPEIQLNSQERFTTPSTFVFLFKGELQEAEKDLSNFIREYIIPFKSNIFKVWYEDITSDVTEEKLIEKVNLAKENEADIFCISENWTSKRGDWVCKYDYIHKIIQHVHSRNMKFGLCIDLAIAEPESFMLTQHPEWRLKTNDNSDYNIPNDNGKLMCLGSEYAVYIAYEIAELVNELKLDYVKLTGLIIPDAQINGCHSKEHTHRSNKESWWYIYDGLFSVIKYLQNRYDHLIVDVSLESYNPAGIPDYAFMKAVNLLH